MEVLLSKIGPVVTCVSMVVTIIVLLATVVARFTKTEKDNIAVGKVKVIVLKILKYLPTIGINPQTKKLEEALEAVSDTNSKPD